MPTEPPKVEPMLRMFAAMENVIDRLRRLVAGQLQRTRKRHWKETGHGKYGAACMEARARSGAAWQLFGVQRTKLWAQFYLV